jgi:CPA2 family monovalent cation:H+ antiporter-2
MPHETPLIATIAAGLVLAFIFGAIANRLRMPPLVGYLVAGVLVGPYTPGFVADAELARELAELGVVLLMFGVGLHFSLKDLLSVRAIAIPGAVAQIAFATLLGAGLALLLGWGWAAGLVFGLALSVASTVVLLRAMQERRMLDTQQGRIAVGWLIVEDLAMVLALVLLPAFAGVLGGEETVIQDPIIARLGGGVWAALGVTFAKVAAFIAVMLIVGRRVIPWILHSVAHGGSRELFRLAVLAIALGVAFGSAELFGVSLALGAFFAGMILSESELSQQAAQETLPLRDAFSVLFFVGVGMLFDPASLVRDPLPILATVAIIMFGKSLVAFVIVIVFRHSVATALIISASLAQIGEFSFILAELGVGLDLLPEQARDLILGSALLSICLNPLMFGAIGWAHRRLERNGVFRHIAPSSLGEGLPHEIGRGAPTTPAGAARAAAAAASGAVPQEGHIVLVGYGRVGSLVGEALRGSGRPFVVIEDSDDILPGLSRQGVQTVRGNAADPDTLALADLAHASLLVVAIPNAFEAGQAVMQARAINPSLHIIGRAHSDAEVAHLKSLGADTVIMGEREIARSVIDEIERRMV